ncbi:MAG: helix-turn-helix transcriptional regulator [Ruminococcaceae bacterium]|nr:helix-turn-helix transcriptional regulator [Oscillospiraceae bacterium]
MKIRKKVYGDCNLVGKNIEKLRKERGIKQKDFISKMQSLGCDINPTSYSKLEGQIRIATDREVFAAARILEVTMERLFEGAATNKEV